MPQRRRQDLRRRLDATVAFSAITCVHFPKNTPHFERHASCCFECMAKPWDLKERTTQFMNDVCRFCRTLPDSREAQEVASQLRRAGRSVAANYRAAIRGDFISKIGLVIEEADEAQFWLDHLHTSEVCQSPAVKELRQEAN